ncbi:MAG: hypothetical protein WEB52_10390 [Dehalococcoidia bacterium]
MSTPSNPTIPLYRLVMSKLLVNQADENVGLRTLHLIGTMFNGIARHTPDGIAWRDMAMKTASARRCGGVTRRSVITGSARPPREHWASL